MRALIEISDSIFFQYHLKYFSVFSLMMLVPFLQLLFKQTKPVVIDPGLHFNAKGALDYFNYQFGIIISQHGATAALIFYVFVCLFFFIKNSTRYVALYCIAPMRHGVIRNIRNNIFKKFWSFRYLISLKEEKGI